MLEAAVKDLGYIQYEARIKEYTFADVDGFPLLHLDHCPWCHADISSLRALFFDKQFDYVREQKALTFDEFERY